MEYVIGPGQVPLYLRTVKEQLNLGTVLMIICFRQIKYNVVYILQTKWESRYTWSPSYESMQRWIYDPCNIKELSILDAAGVLDQDTYLCCVPLRFHAFFIFTNDTETTWFSFKINCPFNMTFNYTWKFVEEWSNRSNRSK